MDDDARFQERIGTVLRDKWTLEKLLGSGGMAAVYVGRHRIGRLDAIKILHPEIARNKDLRARFEQEALAVNRLKHPGAVEIRDIDTSEDGCPFLVMELLEGEPLSDRARRMGGLPPGELLRFVDELLTVLGHAHAQGIIHRDVKPDNLFVLQDGRLKVLDFGIARMREGALQTMHTRTGAMLGTLPYMAPEQILGTPIDARADLFAVGATMFRIIAKRRLHEAVSESDLLVKMATQPAPKLSSVAPDAPHAVARVVDRALAFRREDRYPDAAAMQADVRALRALEALGGGVAVGARDDVTASAPSFGAPAPPRETEPVTGSSTGAPAPAMAAAAATRVTTGPVQPATEEHVAFAATAHPSSSAVHRPAPAGLGQGPRPGGAKLSLAHLLVAGALSLLVLLAVSLLAFCAASERPVPEEGVSRSPDARGRVNEKEPEKERERDKERDQERDKERDKERKKGKERR